MHGLSLRFANLKIKAKLLFGFLVILALAGVLVGMLILTLRSIDRSVQETAGFANDVRGIAELAGLSSDVQSTLERFLRVRSEDQLQQFHRTQSAFSTALAALLDDPMPPDRAIRVRQIADESRTLFDAADRSIALIDAARRLEAEHLAPLTARIRQRFTEMQTDEFNSFSFESSSNIAKSHQEFLLAAGEVQRFLSSPDEATSRRLADLLAGISQDWGMIAVQLSASGNRARLEQIKGDLQQFAEAYQSLARAVSDRDTTIATTLLPSMQRIFGLTRSITDSVAADMDESSSALSRRIASTLIDAIVIAVIALAAGVAVALFMAGLIAQPIRAITAATVYLAEGHPEVVIHGQDRKDEIGEMARAVQVFKTNLDSKQQLQHEQARLHSEAQNRRVLLGLADDFEGRFVGAIETISAMVRKMADMAGHVVGMTGQAGVVLSELGASAGETSTHVQSVASAAGELAHSINEISSQVYRSQEIVGRAVETVNSTNTTVQGLNDAAQKIGTVVDLIADIAAQTNLLALNATIEAARAGDAGKGFAVVASEVKSLASQTSKATEDIAGQIKAIRTATKEAVEAIGGIGSTISEVSEITSIIAAAVEEQAASTREIAGSADHASSGTNRLADGVGEVLASAKASREAGTAVGEIAGTLETQARALQQQASDFLKQIRSS